MKTACDVQCPECPFRPNAANGWLGGYTPATATSAIWKGDPFFCHTKINYSSSRWEERAMEKGKLCLGGLVFARKIGAPQSDDPEVELAREEHGKRRDVECMGPIEFGEHHLKPFSTMKPKPKSRAKAQPKPRASARPKPRKPLKGPPTDAQIDHEIALLEALRPRIVPRSLFGDDNLQALDDTIKVLKDRMTEDDVFDLWDPLDEQDKENGDANADVNEEEGRSYERTSRQTDSVNWMETGEGDYPADGWPMKEEA